MRPALGSSLFCVFVGTATVTGSYKCYTKVINTQKVSLI